MSERSLSDLVMDNSYYPRGVIWYSVANVQQGSCVSQLVGKARIESWWFDWRGFSFAVSGLVAAFDVFICLFVYLSIPCGIFTSKIFQSPSSCRHSWLCYRRWSLEPRKSLAEVGRVNK